MSEERIFKKFFETENLHYCIYSKLLEHERDKVLAARLKTLIVLERKHMSVWRGVLEYYGGTPVEKKYHLYPQLFLSTRLIFGRSMTMRLLTAYEDSSLASFLNVISVVPSSKLKSVVSVITDELYNENFGQTEKEQGILSHVREIVFGMNDGLVEILASVAGIVGIYRNNLVAALAGLIVGISGTLSMAVGAYLSSTSEKDVSTSNLTRLQLELEAARERAAKDLGKAYKSYKSLSSNLDRLIQKLKTSGDPFYKLLEKERSSSIFGFLRRDKNFFDSKEKISPLKDAADVGIFYLLGAVIPLVSFFVGSAINDSVYLNLIISLVAAAVAIFITASIIAINTGESVIKRVSQSLLLSLAAAGATFLIGSIVSSYLNVVV